MRTRGLGTRRSWARALLITTLVLLPASPAAAEGGRIAFISDRTGNWTLWGVDGDGTDLRALTDARTRLVPPGVLPFGASAPTPLDEWDAPASWSPDGSQLAYSGVRTSAASRRPSLFLVDADGGAPRRLTSPTGRGADYDPTWSPDGRHLAFVRFPDEGHPLYSGWPEVWTLDLVSGAERRIVGGWGGSWSPDGRRLVAYDWDGMRWITAAPDGSAVRVVADQSGAYVDGAAWAPRGRRLAFRLGSSSALLVDEDGGRRRELLLAHGQSEVSGPAWSPDGCWLAYTSTDGGPTELRVHPAGYGHWRTLATFPTGEPFLATPAWSPNGRHIALPEYDAEPVVSTPIGTFTRSALDLLVVPFEGGAPRRLVDEPDVWNLAPQWRPKLGRGGTAVHRRAASRRSGARRCRAG